MYTIDEFVIRAPPEAHSQDVMSNHHQLMLNRLSFELVERQRSDIQQRARMGVRVIHAPFSPSSVCSLPLG